MTEVEGYVESGFEGVRDAFAANFEQHGEVGAAFALHVEGRKVVDIWGGTADVRSGRPYAEDTLQLVFSTTKGATAMCANLLAERGLLDVDAPVAQYWPEFAQNGKESITVRMLLNHQAGLYTVDEAPRYADTLRWDPIVDALAAQAPLWEPGTEHGYHAVTYGWLVGEVVRRVTGRSIGAFFQEEFAAPLGLDFWIGLPKEHHERVAPLVPTDPPTDPAARAMAEQLMGPDSVMGRALSCSGALNPDDGDDTMNFNRPDLWSAEVPAANGVTNARSLSRLYASLVGDGVDGIRTLAPETVARATEPQDDFNDSVLMQLPTRFGLGFMLSSPFSPFGGPQRFGHPGAGGSVGFADPEKHLAFGYVMNKMQQNLSGDPRTVTLIEQAYAAL
ncbi:MAG TPA: serine hydrolase domain-containing protein [Acidimicrobiales bacterium]|nr:serine hydrolase domain-containing protein [Acidimicrobiales bacterium]